MEISSIELYNNLEKYIRVPKKNKPNEYDNLLVIEYAVRFNMLNVVESILDNSPTHWTIKYGLNECCKVGSKEMLACFTSFNVLPTVKEIYYIFERKDIDEDEMIEMFNLCKFTSILPSISIVCKNNYAKLASTIINHIPLDTSDIVSQAIMYDSLQILEILLDKGYHYDEFNENGFKPIHYVVSLQCLNKLLEKNVDINSLSKDNETPLDMCYNRSNEDEASFIQGFLGIPSHIIMSGSNDCINKLIQCGASRGQSPNDVLL